MGEVIQLDDHRAEPETCNNCKGSGWFDVMPNPIGIVIIYCLVCNDGGHIPPKHGVQRIRASIEGLSISFPDTEG